MNEKIIMQFTKTNQSVLDLKGFFDQNETYPELKFIRLMLSGIQKTIRAMFFNPGQDDSFLIELIEKLWVDSESALQTIFKIDFYADADDPLAFHLVDDHDSAVALCQNFTENDAVESIKIYLFNTRLIAALMANVFNSQLSHLVQERVVYDRELFNFEDYHTRGLTDERLLSDILFLGVKRPGKSVIKSGKYLMGEFYTY